MTLLICVCPGGTDMNIEDIEKMKWNYAYMKLLSEDEDSYFFGFDIDTKTDLMKGRIKIFLRKNIIYCR